MRKLLKYQEFQVREAGSHEGDPRLSCVPVQGVGLRSLSSGQANDRLCLLYMKTDRPLGLITSLLEVTLSRLFYKLKWSCAVYHICWDTDFSCFFFTAFENTRFQLPPHPVFWIHFWQQELVFLLGVNPWSLEVFIVCIRSMQPTISSWIQEVPSHLDLWTHSESPLTPGSVSLF